MTNSEGIWSCVMMISDGEKAVPIRAERISISKAIDILGEIDTKRGLYWFIDEEKNIVGIDNSTGELWCEDNFHSIGDCIRWLQREDF